MGYIDVRDKLIPLLEAVEGIGQVHNRVRHTDEWEKVFKVHIKKGQFNSWEVTRAAVLQSISAVQGAAGLQPLYLDEHSIQIKGYLALKESKDSETQFQKLIDAIRDKIRLNNQLGGGIILLPTSIQVPNIGHRMYAGVLVHFCEMTLSATERVGG